MVLRMTGAREPSLAMSDTGHVGHVYLLGQQRTQEVAGDRVCFVDLCSLFPLIDCQIVIPKKKENGQDWLCCFCFEEKINARDFLNRNSISGTTLRSSLVFSYDGHIS